MDEWPDPDAPWIGPRDHGDGTVFGIRRDESGTDENHFDVFAEHWEGPVFVATGGMCVPMMPIYDIGSLLGLPGDGWPRRFHLFPRIDQAALALREARWRARHAWLIIRHGADDY